MVVNGEYLELASVRAKMGVYLMNGGSYVVENVEVAV